MTSQLATAIVHIYFWKSIKYNNRSLHDLFFFCVRFNQLPNVRTQSYTFIDMVVWCGQTQLPIIYMFIMGLSDRWHWVVYNNKIHAKKQRKTKRVKGFFSAHNLFEVCTCVHSLYLPPMTNKPCPPGRSNDRTQMHRTTSPKHHIQKSYISNPLPGVCCLIIGQSLGWAVFGFV